MKSTRLKELRKSKGLTLDELAELVGTSKQTIHRYENGIISNIPKDYIPVEGDISKRMDEYLEAHDL